jgi:hypothetical protein
MITGNHAIAISLYYVYRKSHIRNSTADDFFCLSQNQQLFCSAFHKKACSLFSHRDYISAELKLLPPHANIGEGTENSKNAEEPQNNDNDHDGIQDRLDRTSHGDESVDEPKNNTSDDQDY